MKPVKMPTFLAKYIRKLACAAILVLFVMPLSGTASAQTSDSDEAYGFGLPFVILAPGLMTYRNGDIPGLALHNSLRRAHNELVAFVFHLDEDPEDIPHGLEFLIWLHSRDIEE